MADNQLDPSQLVFDPSRWDAAKERLRRIAADMADAVIGAAKGSENLGDLMEHYDFGEPAWNGSLIVLASTLLSAPPTDVVIETFEDLPIVDEDYGRRFHHGNVRVEASFEASENIWITGDLQVGGVIGAGFLDAFPDLLVAGSLSARAASFSGLEFIGGDLTVGHFVMIASQGETIIRGALETPLLLGDCGSGSALRRDEGRYLDIDEDDPPFARLSAALNVAVEPGDEYAFSLVDRAMAALE